MPWKLPKLEKLYHNQQSVWPRFKARQLPPNLWSVVAGEMAATENCQYDPNSLPDLLPIYYKRLFPYGPYFRWLNYGGGIRVYAALVTFREVFGDSGRFSVCHFSLTVASEIHVPMSFKFGLASSVDSVHTCQSLSVGDCC